jgi:hypothetical protein
VPVTVTVSRGTPLPWPVALVFTVVGLGLMVVGFTVVPPVDMPSGTGEDIGSVIMWIIALLLVVPTWIIFLVVMVRRMAARKAPMREVPNELPEPPGDDDVAVVATVVGEGKPAERAIAATVLALADHGALRIDEHGPQVVVTLATDAAASSETERLVLDDLRGRADDRRAVTGPPIWSGRVSWWREFVGDARARAGEMGLVEPRLPFIGLMLVFIMTAVAFSLVFFWRIPVFVGAILFANGVPHLLARASGFRLTIEGRARRAEWLAFGRFLHAQGSLREVGPAAVSVWGPNLVYGIVLGEGARAGKMITPDVEGFDDEPGEIATEYEYKLGS